MTDSDISRVHERLDDLFSEVGKINNSVMEISTKCKPCQETIQRHQIALYGNGKNGLVTRMATGESGRVDTLSIKGVVTLVGAIGAMAATIGAAMGALLR